MSQWEEFSTTALGASIVIHNKVHQSGSGKREARVFVGVSYEY